MRAIYKRPAARQDLVHIFRYYALNASLAVARRFLGQTEATSIRLAKMPGMGMLYDGNHPACAGLRFFPVSRFPKYNVFFRPVTDGIEVVRILHAARDIAAILAEEFGIVADAQDDDQ